MRHIEALRQRGHTLALTPEGRVFHRGPKGATDEIRAHLDEIRAELAEEASATASAAGNPAIAATMSKTTHQDAQPRDLDARNVPEHLRFRGRRRGPAEVWTDETRDLIAWFRTTSPPDEPFDTPGGLTVSNPRRYWEFLAGWIRDGAASPHPGLTTNLRQLRTIWEERHG